MKKILNKMVKDAEANKEADKKKEDLLMLEIKLTQLFILLRKILKNMVIKFQIQTKKLLRLKFHI